MLAVIGAALETLNSQIGNQNIAKIPALTGALALALIPVFSQWKTSTEQLKTWIGSRSISEELKAQVCLYMAQCGAYKSESRDKALTDARDELLRGSDQGAVAWIKEDGRAIPTIKPVGMDGASSYIQQRLNGQIGYYRHAAVREKRKATRYRRIQFTLAIIAAVLGASGAVFNEVRLAAWIAVITTVGTSFAAALAAGRHEHLVINYGSTGDRLESIRDKRDSVPDPCTFVSQCEAAISSQNEGWIVQFIKKPGK